MEVRSIETIVKALNAAKVQYLIVGGLAVYVVFLFWVHAWLFGVSPLGVTAL